MARHPIPSAIHTVEPDASEDELHLAAAADEGLWNRDVSGRLQRGVQHGATGGSEGSDQHF